MHLAYPGMMPVALGCARGWDSLMLNFTILAGSQSCPWDSATRVRPSQKTFHQRQSARLPSTTRFFSIYRKSNAHYRSDSTHSSIIYLMRLSTSPIQSRIGASMRRRSLQFLTLPRAINNGYDETLGLNKKSSRRFRTGYEKLCERRSARCILFHKICQQQVLFPPRI